MKENETLKQQLSKLSITLKKCIEENNLLKKNSNNKLIKQKNINYYKNEISILKKTLNDKINIIKKLNEQLFNLNDNMNKNHEAFNELSSQNKTSENNSNNNDIKSNNDILMTNYEIKIKELEKIIEQNKKEKNEYEKKIKEFESENSLNINNNNIYLNQIKELKEQVNTKDKKIEILEKNNQDQKILNDELEQKNKELKEKIDNNNNNELNNSYLQNKLTELEEKNESLLNKNQELISKLEEKEKHFEEYKILNNDDSSILQNLNKDEYNTLKKKYDDLLKDCENYKKINDNLLEQNNKNNKKILEFNIERETLNKSLELLKQKNEKINDELKSYRKTEKNPFKLNEEMNLDNEKKEEKRYSLGGKETRTEKYKMMMLDYENQNKNDLKQLNMLKADIKGLKSKLKDKDKFIGDIKQLIQVGLKGINGGNKTQKEAIKKLKDIFNEV